MNTFFSLISFFFLCSNIIAQPQAYSLYNQKGKEVAYSKMLKELQSADIVFFGEKDIPHPQLVADSGSILNINLFSYNPLE